MTLGIPDVEKWNPGQLTTAAAAVGKLGADLDQAVNKGLTDTQTLRTDNKWTGQAAEVAETRMTTEKTRASAVSQALVELQGAIGQQVENLQHVKDEVLKLRDLAENAPFPPGAFEVAANGTVTAEERKKWLQTNLPEDTPGKADMILHQDVEAQQRTVELTRALAQAESVAESAATAVATAKGKVDSATAALGDPVTGAGTAAPAPTTPAAASAPAAPPVAAQTPHLVSNVSHGGSGHYGGNGAGYHGGSGLTGTTFSGGLGTGSSGGPPAIAASGDVKQWIAQAKEILLQMGYRPDQIDENALAIIIQAESGGDPNAINLWDSNASAGHPSKGLMQTIDSTFNSYAAPGHTDIWNPVDNIVAGARYALDRYGTLRHPGVESFEQTGHYQGY
ncbi:transglycosylase SLT domain-containing protein [Nocardia sp. NPDC004068]|uniref:transglycosylase SLT domain-containing protein n=1 Tax=Nocardia sp. NPDC004068 TaxID=3364303 RepID=UPI00367FC22E